MANKHMRRGSTLLVIKELWIQTTRRDHSTLITMATMKGGKPEDNKSLGGYG